MGAAGSNPVDEGKRKEIEELTKAVLVTFTTHYVKYAICTRGASLHQPPIICPNSTRGHCSLLRCREYGLALVEKIKQDAMSEPDPYLLRVRPVRQRCTAFPQTDPRAGLDGADPHGLAGQGGCCGAQLEAPLLRRPLGLQDRLL